MLRLAIGSLLVLIGIILTSINETKFRPQNPTLSQWLRIEFIYFFTLGFNKILRSTFRMIEQSENKCAKITRKIIVVLSAFLSVFNPVYFIFLFSWNFYGLYEATKNEEFTTFWFNFVLITVLIFQTIVYLLIITTAMVIGFVLTDQKEKIVLHRRKKRIEKAPESESKNIENEEEEKLIVGEIVDMSEAREEKLESNFKGVQHDDEVLELDVVPIDTRIDGKVVKEYIRSFFKTKDEPRKKEVSIQSEVVAKPEVGAKPEIGVKPEVEIKPEKGAKPEIGVKKEVEIKPENTVEPHDHDQTVDIREQPKGIQVKNSEGKKVFVKESGERVLCEEGDRILDESEQVQSSTPVRREMNGYVKLAIRQSISYIQVENTYNTWMYEKAKSAYEERIAENPNANQSTNLEPHEHMAKIISEHLK